MKVVSGQKERAFCIVFKLCLVSVTVDKVQTADYFNDRRGKWVNSMLLELTQGVRVKCLDNLNGPKSNLVLLSQK